MLVCILLKILEIARNNFFYLVAHEGEKEAAKQAINIRKNNQANVVKYFSTIAKGRKFLS